MIVVKKIKINTSKTLDFKGKIQKKLDCMGLFIYNKQGLCRYLYVFV